MDDIYETIQEYSANKKRKIFIAFDDMIADMLNNKNIDPIVNEIFIRGRKLKIYLVLITQSYFAAPRNIGLNFTYYLIMKVPSSI